MLSSFDDSLHVKSLTYQLTLSQYIDDQGILQYDWTRENWPHPTKTFTLKSYLTLMAIFMQKI